MASSVTIRNPWKDKGYQGSVDMYFEIPKLREKPYPTHQETALKVNICTQRLYLRPVGSKDVGDLASLFGDPEVMEKYAEGKIISGEEVKARVTGWDERWRSNNPISAFVVSTSDYSSYEGLFVGAVVLEDGKEPGHIELTFFVVRNCWNQGYGTEMVTPVVREWAPLLVKRGDQVNGHPFTTLDASARRDNPAACKILGRLIGLAQVVDADEESAGHETVYYEQAVT